MHGQIRPILYISHANCTTQYGKSRVYESKLIIRTLMSQRLFYVNDIVRNRNMPPQHVHPCSIRGFSRTCSMQSTRWRPYQNNCGRIAVYQASRNLWVLVGHGFTCDHVGENCGCCSCLGLLLHVSYLHHTIRCFQCTGKKCTRLPDRFPLNSAWLPLLNVRPIGNFCELSHRVRYTSYIDGVSAWNSKVVIS